MAWLRNLAIGIKLNLLVASTTFVVLTIVLALIVGLDAINSRVTLVRHAEVLGRITSSQLTAPLGLGDFKAAEEILSSLKNQPDIIDAGVWDLEGGRFAYYRSELRNNGVRDGWPDWLTGDHQVECPIELSGQRLGTLRLTLARQSLRVHVNNVTIFVAILFAAGLVVAMALTQLLKHSITSPLSRLANLAKAVSDSKDYSLRLVAESQDEIGILVRSFNQMMAEIALKDCALEEHKQNFEKEVIERTAEFKRAKDEAVEASRSKSQFLANMSHEIRTPLNGILGMNELASELSSSSEQREYLAIVQQSSLSLLSIINDILDFSKIEAGKLELSPVQFDLRRCVDRVLSLMTIQATTKGLTLEAEIFDGLSREYVADEGRIRQVLVNLVGNAIKFTSAGGSVSIRIHGAAVGNGTELVVFEVLDTGIGIAPEKHGQIFEAFSQADGSINRKFGGTGLGLSISRMIVELMGGKIGLTSTVGVGSKFHFEIPLKVATIGNSPISSETVDHKLNGVSVLLVEDNPVNQKIAQKLLGKRGVNVKTANDGAEALVAWREGKFDLILMDCQMPIMSGYESTRSIRREEQVTGRNRIPIVALTAQALAGDKEECLAAGMDGYVSKPINSKKLFDEISRFLTS